MWLVKPQICFDVSTHTLLSRLFSSYLMTIIYLHEEPGHKSLSDVEIVVFAGELGAGPTQVETVHDTRELLANVVRRLQRAVADKVVVAPLVVFAI